MATGSGGTHAISDCSSGKTQLPSNHQWKHHQHSNEEKKDYGKIFSLLNLRDYIEVKPCSFENYLSVIGYNGSVLLTPEGNVMTLHSEHTTVDKKTVDRCRKLDITVKKGEEIPAKKIKSDTDWQQDHSNNVNQGDNSCHSDSNAESEMGNSALKDVVTLDLFTKCVTHPRVVNLIRDLLKEKMEIKC